MRYLSGSTDFQVDLTISFTVPLVCLRLMRTVLADTSRYAWASASKLKRANDEKKLCGKRVWQRESDAHRLLKLKFIAISCIWYTLLWATKKEEILSSVVGKTIESHCMYLCMHMPVWPVDSIWSLWFIHFCKLNRLSNKLQNGSGNKIILDKSKKERK